MLAALPPVCAVALGETVTINPGSTDVEVLRTQRSGKWPPTVRDSGSGARRWRAGLKTTTVLAVELTGW